MPIYSSSSDSDEQPQREQSRGRVLGRERTIPEILGGGRVADVLLWRNKNISAAILVGATVVWLLFEVVEYPFLTLLCHIAITAMLVSFIWCNLAAFFDREPPKIPELILSEKAFKEFASVLHQRLTRFVSVLYDIAFFVAQAIISLWIISVIGSYCSTVNLLYIGFLCAHTLPALYERYEEEVDHVVSRGSKDAKKLYRKFDKRVLESLSMMPVFEGIVLSVWIPFCASLISVEEISRQNFSFSIEIYSSLETYVISNLDIASVIYNCHGKRSRKKMQTFNAS